MVNGLRNFRELGAINRSATPNVTETVALWLAVLEELR